MTACLRLTLFGALALLMVASERSVAQDFFATPDSNSAAATAPADPLAAQWLAHSTKDNVSLGEAIAALTRLAKWSDLNRLLESTAKKNLSDTDQAAVAANLEPAVMVRIAGRADLSEAARDFAESLTASRRKQVEAPERLGEAIGQVQSSDPDEQLAGFRRLLAAGDAAIVPLVSALTGAGLPVSNPQPLIEVMKSLGEPATQALRQIATHGNEPARGSAIDSLQQINREQALSDWMVVLHSESTSESIRGRAANAAMQRWGRLPSRDETIQLLQMQLRDAIAIANETSTLSDPTTVFSINADRDGVDMVRTERRFVAALASVDAANRLLQLGTIPEQAFRQALIADLNYRLMVDPFWGDVEQKESLKKSYSGAFYGAELLELIRAAQESQQLAAVVVLLRLIDQSSDEFETDVLLRGEQPNLTSLVQATEHGEPLIRYEAAAAITRLSPQRPYPGASKVRSRLAEMGRLTDRPQAVLVETRLNQRVSLEQSLTQTGFEVAFVSSVGEMESQLAVSSDVRVILSKTQLADYGPIELVDRVRRNPLGGQIAIGFYGSPSRYFGADRWSDPTLGPVRVLASPETPLGLQPLLDELERNQRLPELSATQRRAFRLLALEQLSG
ncbi:MAG: hypothetical protein AAGA03_05025 [Planctomycetota bacterium]